jgi:hypothetical protein
MRSFFAGRGVQAADAAADEGDDQPLLDNGEAVEEVKDEDEKTTLQRIAAMSVAQRVVTAMKGTREERAILIRDPNKLVTGAVLSSPKLTEREVENIARMTTVSEEALRTIGRTRAWMKNYGVVAGLAKKSEDAGRTVDEPARAVDRQGPEGDRDGPQRARRRPSGGAAQVEGRLVGRGVARPQASGLRPKGWARV